LEGRKGIQVRRRHYVINRRKEDVVKKVREITGRGVDVVVDSVGKETWDKSIRSLGVGGRLISVGATTGPDATIDVRRVFAKQLKILGSYMGSRAELMEVLSYFEDGKLKPVIDSRFPLEEARKAHEKMERIEIFGKSVLIP